tara:strand:- start:1727 stop:4702 length:2976 start_codon:yes stop_codon:yes gene_type:complete
MAYSYTRQSTISDGDTITASLFNNEYNQLLNAFAYSSSDASVTGHRHDGSAAQGGSVAKIGDLDFLNKIEADSTNNRWGFYVQVSSSSVEQIRVQDGAIVPVTDNDIDLGTSSLEFKDLYIDGTAYVDAINFNGTAISSTAAELNILDGVTSTAAELNILDGVTSTAAELNILDGVTASAADINLIDGITNGTVIASKVIITDANKDISGGRNITISGELDAATLDISGDADIDGTLEADAITIAGVTLAETISDTVGAMVGSNTETGISVTYDDSDNTLDFVIGAGVIVSSMLDTNIDISGVATASTFEPDGDTAAGDNAAIGYTAAEGLILTGQGSTSDVTIKNDADAAVISIPTGTTNVTIAGDLTISGDDLVMGTNTAGHILVADGTNFNPVAVGDLSEISTVAADDVFLAVDTSGGGLKKITRSTITAGLATSGAISNVAEDSTPQLGGNLDMNGQDIVTTSNADLELAPHGTGHVTVKGNTNAGAIQFNCESNSHGQIVKAQPHSASVTNELLLPAGSNSTLVSLVSTDTLTNKTLTSPKINEDVAVTSTATEINVLDGITAVVGELNALDLGATAVGTAIASKAVILDANKDYTGLRNFTITGELSAATLDISGDVDIDGTLEADAITVNGTTLAETISDTVGAMVGSNTETGITVAYQDGDNTLDFALGAAQTTITSLLAADIKIGEDDQTKIDFETADEIHFYAANVEQVYVADNIFGPQSDSDVDLGSTSVRWKDAYVDSITVTGEIDGASLDIEGNADINGTTNLDAVDIDGAVQVDATVTVGVDDTGYDVKFFGATSGKYMEWDESADQLEVVGTTTVDGTLQLKNGSTSAGKIEFFEDSDNGTNKVTLIGPASTADITLTLPSSNGDAGQSLITDGSGTLSFSTIGGAYSDFALKTTNYTASAKDQLICNHASTVFTITLPASPTAMDTVVICNAGAATVTVARNSSNINSLAQDSTLVQGASTQLVYVDSTIGWFEI